MAVAFRGIGSLTHPLPTEHACLVVESVDPSDTRNAIVVDLPEGHAPSPPDGWERHPGTNVWVKIVDSAAPEYSSGGK